ncbi:MAG: hypothetical protein IPJ65_21745 [Archangiaceae bacterium]|nr:hypothetical protein [Archangiaceae bacterium]
MAITARAADGTQVDEGSGELDLAEGMPSASLNVRLKRTPPPGTLTATPFWQLAPPTKVGSESSPIAVVFTNGGFAPSEPLLLPSGTSEFSYASTCTGQPVPVNGSCAISIVFHPTVAGRRRANAGIFIVEGDGIDDAQLTVHVVGQPGDHVTFLGQDCIGDCSASVPSGDVVTLRALPGPGSSLGGFSAGECGGKSTACLLPVTGQREVTVTFDAFAHPLTVLTAGPGSVSVDADPQRRACPPNQTCEWWFPVGARPVLRAAPDVDRGLTSFQGACATVERDTCKVDLSAPRSVTAGFGALNFSFVTSAPMDGGVTSLADADAWCTAMQPASNPGVYRAWLSAPGLPAAMRFAGAYGWQNSEGRPFADSIEDLLGGRLAHAAGSEPLAYATGTLADGGVGQTCNGWTGTGTYTAGEATLSTEGWTAAEERPCSEPMYLLCLGASFRSLPASQAPPTAHRQFISRAQVAGSTAYPDGLAACANEAADAGLVGAFPFTPVMAGTPSSMGTLLFGLRGHRRLDGVDPIDGVITASNVAAPMNLTADGRDFVGLEPLWVGGSTDFTRLSDASETCDDWDAGSAGTGRATLAPRQGNAFYERSFLLPCGSRAHVLCVEGP